MIVQVYSLLHTNICFENNNKGITICTYIERLNLKKSFSFKLLYVLSLPKDQSNEKHVNGVSFFS